MTPAEEANAVIMEATQTIVDMREQIARLTRERDEARWAATCDVCLGDPLPGTRGCICGGTGKLADTALGLREELARADNRAVAAEKELRIGNAKLVAAEARAGSPYADPLDTQTCPRCSGHGVVPLEVTAADLRRRLLAVAAFCRHETMCNQVVYGEPCTCGLDALLTLPRVRAAEREERGKEKGEDRGSY